MIPMRVPRLTLGLLAAGLIAPPVMSSSNPAASKLAGSRTVVEAVTSAAGARAVELQFAAGFTGGLPDLLDDVEIGWGQVGGVEPVPFRVLIPAGCFSNTRRGFRVRDFATCGVQLWLDDASRGLVPLPILQFDAAGNQHDDGTFRLRMLTTFIPPDPVVPPDPIIPPDPIHAFLGLIGGAIVQIAAGPQTMVSPPLRAVTVSGIEPTPF